MSLRTGGREAVEDTPVTGTPQEVIQSAIEESDAQTPYLDSESYDIAGNVIDALAESGYVIVRAEDALTAEQRAAIGFVVRCLKEVCCDVESPHYLNEEGAEIARRVEAIAEGGQA